MNKPSLIGEHLRLTAELWLHRHGPWWLVLAAVLGGLLSLDVLVMPRLAAELAAAVATLGELQARIREPSPIADPPVSASARNYAVFSQMLADDEQVLPGIEAVLDLAGSHHLISTRAEYARSRDANAQAESVQMTVPVKGRYGDIRRWVEEILATQAFVAVNELGFRREDIGAQEIEARVRLTIWHHPAHQDNRSGRIDADEVNP